MATADHMQHAAAAIAIAKAHVDTADPAAHLLDQLKQFPQVQPLLKEAMDRVGQFMELLQELQGNIDMSAATNIADAIGNKDAAKLKGMKSPLPPDKLESAIYRLRELTDVKDLLDKAEKLIRDKQFQSSVRHLMSQQSEKADIESVRGALRSVDPAHVGIVTQLSAMVLNMEPQGAQISDDVKKLMHRIHQEMEQLIKKLIHDVERVLKLTDEALSVVSAGY